MRAPARRILSFSFLLLAIFLLFGSLPDVSSPTIKNAGQYDAVSFPVQRNAISSEVMRISIHDGCLIGMQFNNFELPLNTELCDQPITLSLEDHLREKNTLSLYVRHEEGRDYRLELRPLRATWQIMLAAVLSLLAVVFYLPKPSPSPMRETDWHMNALAALAILLPGAFARSLYMDFNSSDYQYFLNDWLTHIRYYGIEKAYAFHFNDYAPLYCYLLGLADLMFPAMQGLHLVKWLSFAGEVIAASYIWRIVALKYGTSSSLPTLAASCLFLCPSLIANGASAGQADVFYTACLLATVYYLFCRRPGTSMVAFGIALAFKQQAIFLAPFLLLCFLKGMIPWRYSWIPPAIYALSLLPAGLQGRPWDDLLTIYFQQFQGIIPANAGNAYAFMRMEDESLIRTGFIVTAITISCFLAIAWRRGIGATVSEWMLLATFFVMLSPFVLPKMHDRYFYPADLFTYTLLWLEPGWGLLPALMLQFSSPLSYISDIFPGFDWTGWDGTQRRQIASLVNTLALSFMTAQCFRHLWLRPRREPSRLTSPA